MDITAMFKTVIKVASEMAFGGCCDGHRKRKSMAAHKSVASRRGSSAIAACLLLQSRPK